MTDLASAARPLVIDTHTHFVPAEARGLLGRTTGGGPRLATLRSLPDESPLLEVESRLAEMDELGIDVGVVSLPPVGLLPDQGLVRELIAVANDGLLAVCAAHPDRFVMLASLPLPDAVASLAELDRLVGEPALRGITYPAQATLHRPDQTGMEWVMARAAEHGLVAMIHPSGASTELGTIFEDFNMSLSLHAMLSGPVVTVRMIASGMFDRIPRAELIVPNLGGVLPFIASRLNDRLSGSMADAPLDYLRRNVFYDTSAYPAGPAFRCTLDAIGVSQVVFGTDYPSWEMAPAWDAVEEMDLPDADSQAILGGTASRWFDPGHPRITAGS